MNAVRPTTAGKARTCPHCKATILESASVCPGCHHHLRFDSEAQKGPAARQALRIEGKLKHEPRQEPWEYCVVVAVRNEKGEEVARQVVNVGALQLGEERTFALSVEVIPPRGMRGVTRTS